MEYKIIKQRVHLLYEGNDETTGTSNEYTPPTLEGYTLTENQPTVHYESNKNYVHLVYIFRKAGSTKFGGAL